MDERRPDSIPVTPPRRVTPKASLSPLQKAWAAYRQHTTGCPDCRTTDGRCDEAARLWRIHRDLCDEAYRALAAQRARSLPQG